MSVQIEPHVWGPSAWKLLFCMAISLPPHRCPKEAGVFYDALYSMCRSLPCKSCSRRALRFLKNVDAGNVATDRRGAVTLVASLRAHGGGDRVGVMEEIDEILRESFIPRRERETILLSIIKIN